jgi:phosphoadenosine phosphosulfate reductase
MTILTMPPQDQPNLSGSPEEAANGPVASVVERYGMDLQRENAALESATAEERVAWAIRHFPEHLALSSSFGAQAAVMLHLVTRQWPAVPVILVDTGYLFPETYAFIDELSEKLTLNLKVYRSPVSPAWQERRYGRLWEQGLNGIEKYNQLNKVEPMNRALEELKIDAWLTGLRRQQSSTRKNLTVLATSKGRVKIHPIVDWTDKNVFEYLKKRDLPYHPLWEDGYVSIGDWHTSHKLTAGMTVEETRFFGLKRECGLHEDADFVI